MTPWDSESLRSLRQLANDLTALSATLEVFRVRRHGNPDLERAIGLVDRMILDVHVIVGRLRER